MPKGLNNWGYKDVIRFLREKNFTFYKPLPGSHEQWISSDRRFIVDIDFKKGGHSYPPRTLESMIRDSGIPKKEWRDWAGR